MRRSSGRSSQCHRIVPRPGTVQRRTQGAARQERRTSAWRKLDESLANRGTHPPARLLCLCGLSISCSRNNADICRNVQASLGIAARDAAARGAPEGTTSAAKPRDNVGKNARAKSQMRGRSVTDARSIRGGGSVSTPIIRRAVHA